MSKNSSSKVVENESELEQWLHRKDDFLLIIDIHLNWTGRCESLIPQLDALYRTVDQSETRWKVLSLEVPKFASKFQSIVELSSSCSNSFSSLIDSTSNMENENENLSECLNGLTTKKASCSPLFFVVKGCKVVSIVQGANFPALSKSIYEHLPSLSDDEIIEDGA